VLEIHVAALGVERIEHPRIDADHLAEFFHHFIVRA
jgi:hypothetical protein